MDRVWRDEACLQPTNCRHRIVAATSYNEIRLEEKMVICRFAIPFLLLLTASLTSCSAQEENRSPVETIIQDRGPPITLQIGTRVRVDGRLSKIEGKPALLRYRVGTGNRGHEDCALLRGLEDVSWTLRWKAHWLSDEKTLLAVTGTVLNERFPTFRTAGQHTHDTCLFAMKIDKIDTL